MTFAKSEEGACKTPLAGEYVEMLGSSDVTSSCCGDIGEDR
jgi:hypothetical protein